MMQASIANVTRQNVLASTARFADSYFSRLLGLLISPALPDKSGLVLQPCSSIHTLGMRFAIDALYIDHNNRVLHAIQSMKPWRIGPIDPYAAYVIELPAGVIAQTQTHIGDHIQLMVSG